MNQLDPFQHLSPGRILCGAGTLGEVEKELKSQTKDKERKKQADLVHRKWLTMGGGFYGVVAVLTLLWIELWEIIDFITGFGGLGTLAELFSVGTLVGLIIETLMNTLTALVWPLYWLGSTQGAGWIWILAAYAEAVHVTHSHRCDAVRIRVTVCIDNSRRTSASHAARAKSFSGTALAAQSRKRRRRLSHLQTRQVLLGDRAINR